MNHRDLNSIVQSLGEFIRTDRSCRKALSHLGKGVEIGMEIDKQVRCALGRGEGGDVFFAERAAVDPDVVFELTADAADFLSHQKDLSIGDLGVEVLKQYIDGGIRIRVESSLWSILKNGYMGIIKDAGAPFAKFIAQHGVSNISKIPEIIKKLRAKA